MHFMALAFVEISQVQENKELKQKLEELTLQKQLGTGNIMQDIMIEKYRSLQTEFSRALVLGISNMMYPYWMSMEDPNYMEFYDETDWLREKYNDGIDCIKLPQGTIVEHGDDPIGDCFVAHNENMSFKEFAEKICGAIFDENHQGYGYYYNLNAMYDYYSIGGRWSYMFLVKETCEEYFVGRRSQDKSDIEQAPKGYRWVCAARKRDIEWDIMRDWKNQKTTERFFKLKHMFQSGKIDIDFAGEIIPDGVKQYGKLVYRKGTTLEEYLEEHGISKSWKYPIDSYDIVNADHWINKDDHAPGISNWHNCIDQYIDDTDEDTVLVAVDYHR